MENIETFTPLISCHSLLLFCLFFSSLLEPGGGSSPSRKKLPNSYGQNGQFKQLALFQTPFMKIAKERKLEGSSQKRKKDADWSPIFIRFPFLLLCLVFLFTFTRESSFSPFLLDLSFEV